MEKKLKICFLGNAASIHTIKWVSYFAEKGHEVHLFSYDNPQTENVKGIRFHLLDKKFSITMWPFNTLVNLPFTVKKLKRAINRIKPDLVHAHYVTSYGGLALLSGFRPLIVTAWGSDVLIAPKNSLIARITVSNVFEKSELITCDAFHMKKAIMKFGVPESKIKIINFGIDIERFSPGKKNERLLEKLGILSNQKVVISLRRLGEIYNVETLIKAIPLIINKFPSVKFLIVGEGSRKEYLENLAGKLEVSSKVNFVGFVPNEKLIEYLKVSDIYVSTSLSDGGIASSTAEAMACKLPVVITDVADNKEWVKDGENGYLIPVKSPQKLAEKVIYLLQRDNLRKEMGEKGREMVELKNSYKKEMGKMEKIYKKIVNKNDHEEN